MTVVFHDDVPYLDHDTVFGARDDLAMSGHEQPAVGFPEDMATSSGVNTPFLSVNVDVILSKF